MNSQLDEVLLMLEVEYGLPIAKKYCDFPALLLEITSCLPDLSSQMFEDVRSEYRFCVHKLVWQEKNLRAFYAYAESTGWANVEDYFNPALDFDKSY